MRGDGDDLLDAVMWVSIITFEPLIIQRFFVLQGDRLSSPGLKRFMSSY